MYAKMLEVMQRAIKAGDLNCERVEIPYEGASFPTLFVKGHGEGPRPCMVFCNALDSVKEMIYLCVRELWSGSFENLGQSAGFLNEAHLVDLEQSFSVYPTEFPIMPPASMQV